MRRFTIPLALIMCLFFTMGSVAQNQIEDPRVEEKAPQDYSLKTQWGIGLKAGFLGFGGEVVKGFGDRLNLRLGYSGIKIPVRREVPLETFSILAEASFHLGGASCLIDYYLVNNAIHLTAGIWQNGTLADLRVSTPQGMPHGDLIIPADDVGFVFAEMTTSMPVCPYLALGFGNTLSRDKRVSFNFEMGALMHGSPEFYMDGEGIVGPVANENNIEVLNTAFGPYQWLPVVTMQLTFKIL